MIRKEVIIRVPEGLHARPAAEFVRLCIESGERVVVRRTDGKEALGSSMLAIMTLGLKKGEMAIIEAPDSAETLVEKLIALLG
jgi:phosphocarrier protein